MRKRTLITDPVVKADEAVRSLSESLTKLKEARNELTEEIQKLQSRENELKCAESKAATVIKNLSTLLGTEV